MAACEAALKVNPDYLDALRLRLELHRSLKHYDEMIRFCNDLRGPGQAPRPPFASSAGLPKRNSGTTRARSRTMRSRSPCIPVTGHFHAARAVYLVTSAPRPALRRLQEAIRLDASNADAYLGRGLALAALGQHRDAVADAVKALGLSEPTATRLYSAARIHALAAMARPPRPVRPDRCRPAGRPLPGPGGEITRGVAREKRLPAAETALHRSAPC